jgi:hypothetical protein
MLTLLRFAVSVVAPAAAGRFLGGIGTPEDGNVVHLGSNIPKIHTGWRMIAMKKVGYAFARERRRRAKKSGLAI